MIRRSRESATSLITWVTRSPLFMKTVEYWEQLSGSKKLEPISPPVRSAPKILGALKHLCALAVVSFFLIYNFFAVGKYSAYPWWHQHGNDVDGTYAGTTVALLNNGPLLYIHHPGGMVYSIHGTVYRFLAFFNDAYYRLMHLREVRNYNQAVEILDLAVHASRIITLFIGIGFLIVFYAVIYRLTRRLSVAFLLTFFLGTSKAFVQHTYMIRPEVPNLLFFLAGLCWTLVQRQRKKLSFRDLGWSSVPIGIFLVFSILSKIQIGPGVAIYFVLMMCFLLWGQQDFLGKLRQEYFYYGFVLSLINFLAMPWWALKRPGFLTPEYVHALHPASDDRKVYGAAPENFFAPILILCGLMCIVSGVLWMKKEKVIENVLLKKISSMVLFFNMVISGGILAVYLIFLPVSATLTQYMENTRHLVYATLTNVTYGGFLVNRVINLGTLKKIWTMHAGQSQLAGINFLYVAIGVFIAATARLFLKSTTNKGQYGIILVILGLGLMMDVLASMRWQVLYVYYAFYSLTFLTLSVGWWMALEWQNKRDWISFVKFGVLVLFAANVFVGGWALLAQPKASGVSHQNPLEEYQTTRSLGASFWKVVDESIKGIN